MRIKWTWITSTQWKIRRQSHVHIYVQNYFIQVVHPKCLYQYHRKSAGVLAVMAQKAGNNAPNVLVCITLDSTGPPTSPCCM